MAEVINDLASRVNGIRKELFSRLPFSDGQIASEIRVTPLPGKNIHQVGIVEVSIYNKIKKQFPAV